MIDITVDTIIKNMEDMIENKIPVSPNWWIEQAQKLAVLMGDETDLLHKMQKQVAQHKVMVIEEGKSVAEAKLRAEASEVYEQMLNQKAKCERITEIIRIAKLQARMKNEELGSGGIN